MKLSMKAPVTVVAIAMIIMMAQVSAVIAQPDDRPNVLLIMIDDLNDYIDGMNGHPQVQTPHIDALAQTGVAFTNAHSNYPLCAPSRASLMTGIYPHQSKMLANETPWHRNPVLSNSKTIMEYFSDNGYYVTGSGKLLHRNQQKLWDEWGVDINNYGPFAFNGHERVGHPSVPAPFRNIGPVDGGFAPISDLPTYPDSISNGNYTGYVYGWDNKPYRYISEQDRDPLPDEMHADWAARKMNQLEKSEDQRPFFMGVGFVRPHTPLYAPKKYFERFPLDEIELPVQLEGDDRDTYYDLQYPVNEAGKNYTSYIGTRIPNRLKGRIFYRALRDSYSEPDTGLRHFVQAYLACIAFVDDQVGKVMQALNNSRFKDNTIVVLASDHGWNMGEKNYLFKDSPWEESTRVPMVIRAPGQLNRGERVEHPVSLIDIYPTLKDLAGLEGPTVKNENGRPLDGFSLKPFLMNPDTNRWEGPNGALTTLYGGEGKEPDQQTYSYRTRNWRFIQYPNGMEELYYHEADPYEWHNLAYDKRFYEQKMRLKEAMMELVHAN